MKSMSGGSRHDMWSRAAAGRVFRARSSCFRIERALHLRQGRPSGVS